jgi:hypothetical protein
MLEAAMVVEAALRKTNEPAIIAGLLLFNALVGRIQERRAHAALSHHRGVSRGPWAARASGRETGAVSFRLRHATVGLHRPSGGIQ